MPYKYHPHRHMGLWALATGMLIGAAMGLVFAPKKGEILVKETAEKARKLARKLNASRQEIEQMIMNIFGEVSDDIKRNYVELKGEVLSYADELKESGNLTWDTYKAMLEETVREYAEKKDWSEKTIKRLIKNFEKFWDDISD